MPHSPARPIAGDGYGGHTYRRLQRTGTVVRRRDFVARDLGLALQYVLIVRHRVTELTYAWVEWRGRCHLNRERIEGAVTGAFLSGVDCTC
jgi:hypothetical protein